MGSVRDIQAIIDRIRSGEIRTSELRDLVHHDAALVRVNALHALAPRVSEDESIVGDLVAAALDSVTNVRLLGTNSVAHVAVAALFQSRNSKAAKAGKELLAELNENERNDLIWYLRSEAVPFDEET